MGTPQMMVKNSGLEKVQNITWKKGEDFFEWVS